jgi:hypothetical protein
MNPIIEYVHKPLNQEVMAIGGSYMLNREERLTLGGDEILYLVGYGIFDRSCCGAGGCGYALVQGRIVRWQVSQTDDGEPISEITRVQGADERRRIEAVIKKKEFVPQVVFL